MSDRLQPEKRRGGGTPATAPRADAGPGPPDAAAPAFVGRARSAGFGPVGGGLGADDTDFRARYPALAEYLTLLFVEGKRRQTATLTLFCELGQFKCCLADRDEGTVLFRSAKSFAGVLEAMEGCLTDGTADWREKRGRP